MIDLEKKETIARILAATSILTEHILRTLEAVRQIPSDVLS